MKYTKAEAKAYNDNIKNNMSAKNKAELLFDDLIRFAKLELKIRASIGIKKFQTELVCGIICNYNSWAEEMYLASFKPSWFVV
ncbi:MAG: hypothetical protein IKK93_12525, partial [Campylobacter sp.]|nr:hypothetical protein [Campylobacter sp.]